MYRRDKLMEKLVAEATVEQRSVLGFPPQEHNYWTRKHCLLWRPDTMLLVLICHPIVRL